jgi:large subunit ribosomal protein L22
MEVKATAKFVRVQPRKVRQIAREVRGKAAVRAADTLRFHPSKGARMLEKVIRSAVANAQENHQADPDTLKISDIQINEGPVLKRIRARAMGRANRILKKMSHITVVVEEVEARGDVKPHGTKAKPRPSFAAPKGKGKKKDAVKTADETVVTAEEAVVTEQDAVETAEEAVETPQEATEEAKE